MAIDLNELAHSLQVLAIYGLGIAAFTLVVAILYIPMSHRFMFARRVGDRAVVTSGRRFAYVLLFPLVSFAFFLVMVGALKFLSSSAGPGLEDQELLTISMGIVLAIRITAYFHEKAAEELGKIMPLGLLGVFLVTSQVDSLADSLRNLGDLLALWDHVLLFFVVIVLVEFLLRGIWVLFGGGRNRQARPAAAPPTRAGPPTRPGPPPAR